MSFRKSLAWSFNQEMLTFILQFAGSIIMARLLTPAEFGVFALAMATSYLLSSFRNFGIGSYLIREKTLCTGKIETAFTLWISLSWTLGLLLLLSKDLIANAYGEPGISDVMLVLAGSFLITPFGQPANSLLMREMRFDLLHHINLFSLVCGLATNIGLAWLGFSYMALAWGLLVNTSIRAAALLWVKRDHIKLGLSLQYWREVMSFGGFLTAASLAGEINQHGIKFVIGGLINPSAVALFERAIQIPGMARQVIFKPLGPVLFPKFSEDIREGRSIGPAVEKIIGLTTALIFPAFLVIALCAESIVVILFGDSWRIAGQILPWLLLSNALLALLPQPEQILVPHGEVKRLFKLRSLGMLSNMLTTSIGAWHSLELFAVLRPVQALIFLALMLITISPFWGTGISRLLPLYGKSMLLSLLTALPAATSLFYYGTNIPAETLLIIAFSSIALWVASLHLLKHPLLKEIEHIKNRLTPSKQ